MPPSRIFVIGRDQCVFAVVLGHGARPGDNDKFSSLDVSREVSVTKLEIISPRRRLKNKKYVMSLSLIGLTSNLNTALPWNSGMRL